MARPPSLTASAPRRFRSPKITASATRVDRNFSSQNYGYRLAMPWQLMALGFTATIPELQYASKFYARMLEKVRIYPALRTPDGKTKPIEEGLPVEILDRVQDPGGGRSQLQYRYGLFQFVTGECYLFGRNLDGNNGPERWSMVWREELKFDGDGRVTHMLAPQVPMDTFNFVDDNYEPLPEGSAEAYRMWTPSLRFSGWPTSPMEAVMQMSNELMILSSSVEATATSRLVRSKMLFLPSEMEPAPLDTEGDEDPMSSPFLNDLVAHMENAIDDPQAASSLAPCVTFMDGELIGLIRDISLHDTSSDYLEKDLRKEAIERIIGGLDLPPEVVAGMSSANHWAAWWISDDMWRSHGEPIAEQFCDDMCEAYLRPALREAEYEDWDKVVVDFDATAVIVNPDRSKDADTAYAAGVVSDKGVRAMKNIPEEYAPSPEEKRLWAATKGVMLDEQGNVVADSAGDASAPADGTPPGDVPGPPAGQPGEVSENTNLPASAFQAAAQMALVHCREVAGARIRARRSSCPECIESVKDIEKTLVASALGMDVLTTMKVTPAELVAGGADSFRQMLMQWGNDYESAKAVARLVENHAARTLMQEQPSISTLASLEMVT